MTVLYYPSDPLVQRMRFSPEIAQAVDRIEAINRVATQLQKQGHTVAHTQDAAIDDALLVGAKNGLFDVDDQIAYAWRAIHMGQVFVASPALPALIARSVSSGAPLDDVLDQANDVTLSPAA